MDKPGGKEAFVELGISQEFLAPAIEELRKALRIAESITTEELSDIIHANKAVLNRLLSNMAG